jgi:antitoxin MazE
MTKAIHTRLIRIGNSQGIRIPKALIEQARLTGDVELLVQNNQLVVRPAPAHPRTGWENALRSMAEHGDDSLLDAEHLGSSEWDETEWEW